jgi:signal transduction histidine kinase
MTRIVTETLATFERIGERIGAIFRQAEASPRARQLAEMLCALWPSAPLYICRLGGSDESDFCVLDENGQVRREWEESLRAAFNQGDTTGERKQAFSGKLPPALKLPGYSLVSEEIAFRARSWGVLALAISNNGSPETLAGAGALLAVCGAQLGAHLYADAKERHLQTLQRELERQSSLASTGELAGPLTHEFNNFLNIVLLHVALLETEIPEKLLPDLMELRRQGAGMTSLVKQFQQYRRRLQAAQEQVDINSVVREAIQSLTRPHSEPSQGLMIKLPPSSSIERTGLDRPASVPLNLALAPEQPSILGSAADLRRLCTFLLINAAAAAGPVGGSVALRTESSDSQVFLHVEDTGPSVSPELLFQLLEPTTAGRPGTNSLELAACEALVRRLHGRIRCENRVEGGLVVIVELPRMSGEKLHP